MGELTRQDRGQDFARPYRGLKAKYSQIHKQGVRNFVDEVTEV